jgi:hypothetical protein
VERGERGLGKDLQSDEDWDEVVVEEGDISRISRRRLGKQVHSLSSQMESRLRPPSPANLWGPLPINGNTLAAPRYHPPLRPLYSLSSQCLLPKQIFPYITTHPSTRLFEFTARSHLTSPCPSPGILYKSNKIPRLQMSSPITPSPSPCPSPLPPSPQRCPNSRPQTSLLQTFHTL